MKHYMRSSDGVISSTEDVLEWGRWYENADRQVARDHVEGTIISTVFLSVDHNFSIGPPLLWETMIFHGAHDGYQERYTTEKLARARHTEIVRRLRKGLPLDRK